MVAARVHVVKPPGDITALFGDRQPLIASGPIAGDDPNNLDSEIRFDSNHNDINIVDPTGANAALNVTDEGAKAEWLSDFVGESSVYLEGAGGTGASTAVSQDGTILNNDSLQSISETLYAYASSFNAGNADYNITGDASNGTKIKNADLLNIGGPGQVVIWDQGNNMRVENGRTLSGSGTLIITRRLEVDEGATFIWDGDVIIMGSQNHAKLEIQDGTVTINGNLIAATDPNGNKRADVRMSSNSILNITNTNGDGGSFLMLSRGGEAEFHLDTSNGGSNSPTVNVDGVLALLGDDIDVRLEGKHSDHAVLNISGGLVIAVPEEGDGIKRLRFDHIDMDIIFDETNYDEAINGLGDFFGTIEDPSDPVEITTKWDRSGYVGVAGQALYDEQTADLAAGNYKVD
jgi:hypothetical protein